MKRNKYFFLRKKKGRYNDVTKKKKTKKRNLNETIKE